MKSPVTFFSGRLLVAISIFSLDQFFLGKGPRGSLPSIAIDLRDDKEIGIQEMRVIGPFPLATELLPKSINTSTLFGSSSDGMMGLQVDYLKELSGKAEAAVTTAELLQIERPASIQGFVSHNVSTVYGPLHEKLYLDFKALFGQSAYSPPRDALPGSGVRELATDLTTTYSAFQIDSSTDGEAVLLAGADDAVKIWLNNALVFEHSSVGPPPCENPHMQMVRLKKGMNLVLAKVFNTGASWGLTLRITTPERARSRLAQHATGKMLETRLLTPGHTPEPSPLVKALYNGPDVSEVTLLNSGQQLVSSENCFPGVYTARIEYSAGEIHDTVYCGPDLNTLLGQYETLLARATNVGDQDRINAGAAVYRLRHLLKPEHRKESDPGWQSKILFIIAECEQIFVAIHNEANTSRDRVGRHLRGFRSTIDGSAQHYMVYAPKQYQRTAKGVPLVVRLPYVTKPARHFLESYHVANTDLIVPLEYSADRHGYVVVWPNGRSGTSAGHPIGIKDIFETIDAVKSDYSIDSDRIYLIGGCSGGLEALTIASHYPGRFAAIAVTSPLFNRENSSDQERLSLSSPETARAAGIWNRRNSADVNIRNLFQIPVLIIHEEAHRHAPIEPSFQYVRTAKARGNPVTMETINFGDNTVCTIRSPIARAFEFFRGKRAMRRPDRISLDTWELKYGASEWLTISGRERLEEPSHIEGTILGSHEIEIQSKNVKEYTISFDVLGGNPQRWQVTSDGVKLGRGIVVVDVEGLPNQAPLTQKTASLEGPIIDAFSGSFLVVPGTSGDLTERASTDAIVRTLKKQWKESYYAELPTKPDYQLSAADFDKCHLILVGNERTNLVLRRLQSSLGFQTDVEGLSLGSRRFFGTAVGFSFIKPNPASPSRYVVVIGGNAMSQFDLPIRHLWLEGVYDYVVWSRQHVSQSPSVLDVGYFDAAWNKMVSVAGISAPSSESSSASRGSF